MRDRLYIKGEKLDPMPGMVLMMNKPIGVTCSHKEVGKLVYDFLPDRWRHRTPVMSTIGRLDKDTSGLLLITDDGELLHKIIGPKNHVKKVYLVDVAAPLTKNAVDIFASGALMLRGDVKPLASAELKIIDPKRALITITEGRYHQVRRNVCCDWKPSCTTSSYSNWCFEVTRYFGSESLEASSQPAMCARFLMELDKT